MTRVVSLLIISIPIFFSILSAQGIQSFSLSTQSGNPRPPSNSIDVLLPVNDTLWAGTGRGVTNTVNGTLWTDFSADATFAERGISALAANDTTLWGAVGYSTTKDGDAIQTGGGLQWSSNRGKTWTSVPQPVDHGTIDTLLYGSNKIPALAITVPQQNITYDIAITQNTIWIASFAGMLRKSTNSGSSWDRVVLPPDNLDSIKPTDTLDFDLTPSGGALGLRENLNHRVFSVHASNDSVLWVGTAGGINKSTDGGISWTKMSHSNQSFPISGNFVVALNEQRFQSRSIIWASTVNAVDQDEQQGVSFSEDGGLTWQTTLLGERAHNITFHDSITYVATDRGIFRSHDLGATWIRNGTVYDNSNLQRFTRAPIYAVAVQGDTVWVGGPDGVAYTIDSSSQPFGSFWRVFRTYESAQTSRISYSYPSPFSPDDETVRIHFAVSYTTQPVTIRIFDYAMLPVKTLIQNAVRNGPSEYDELWDGRTDAGSLVTNGVYFYRIEMARDEVQWGKIFVIR